MVIDFFGECFVVFDGGEVYWNGDVLVDFWEFFGGCVVDVCFVVWDVGFYVVFDEVLGDY